MFLRTKLIPPRPSRHTLGRPRLLARLREAESYRVTTVQAGTGYGKTTAVSALAQTMPTVWYQLNSEDADPHLLFLHLIHGLAEHLPDWGSGPLAQLEQWAQHEDEQGTAVADALAHELATHLNHPLALVLDDAQRLNASTTSLRLLDRFINRAPHWLHPILVSRQRVDLPSMVTWRVRGHLLEIGQEELAFTAAEIAQLFAEQYHITLTEAQVALLTERTEGWPIALPLIWQRLQRGDVPLAQAISQLAGTAGDLFTFLAQEVLAQQPDEVRDFLRLTAVLRDLTADCCDDLRGTGDSDLILQYLHENSLFIVPLADGHSRYHHLFRDLLRNQLPPANAQAAHLRAAEISQRRGDTEERLYHLLQARAFGEAADLLAQLGREMIRVGRLATLGGWLGSLPPDVLAEQPILLTYMGDIARLHSRFEEALGWYQQAEGRSKAQGDKLALGQALRGQARVYLDTVNPSQAEKLLQEALRLADGVEDRESRARLLHLLAENLLNQGKLKEAEAYQVQARQLRQEGPSEVELPVRLLLRTGRLAEAQALLEAQMAQEAAEPILRPRAHRETSLLLSLILAFQGEKEAALGYAQEGTARGEALESGFITAVGWMRQGHAHLLAKNEAGYAQAQTCFEKAIALSEKLMVPRLKVEAYWGLTQSYGFRGELARAEQTAEAGIGIASQAGDEWIVGGLHLALGASFALARQDEAAVAWLGRASTIFNDCGDSYGETVTRLWQALLWQWRGDGARLERDVADLLGRVQTHGYEFVFRRPVLLGPPDPHALLPLLLWARGKGGAQGQMAQRLLTQLGLAHLETHPGYQLRVQTLGGLRLWRGTAEVAQGEWKRQKARQLFLLLITHRQTLLEREQIVEQLWPELPPEQGERDFKIAYTTLAKVLEPERDRQAPSAFIGRDGTRYGWRTEADVWLDAAEFEGWVGRGDKLLAAQPEQALTVYQQAIALYGGDFLQEYRYEEWCSEERERLLTLFLRTAERVGHLLAERGRWEEVVAVGEQIVARDDCWEEAYRLLMRAHGALGNRPQAVRVFQRCVERLQAELGVGPAGETVRVYEGEMGDRDRGERGRLPLPKV
ncbi:MAG: BTAD domain-containing putative transcriptional regulator [Chloroflexi bacterium]|nr:BTAD domain-containing putative transcriptional regulator [Chloroflexota bacterium]